MGVQIALAMAQALPVSAGIPQMVGHGVIVLGADCLQRIIVAEGGVRFGCSSKVKRRLRQVKLPFREANPFKGRRRRLHHHHGMWISEAHILGGGDQHAAEQEPGVFACIDHPRQPVECSIRIGSTQRLD